MCRGSGTDTLPSDGPHEGCLERACECVVPRVRAEERAATLREVIDWVEAEAQGRMPSQWRDALLFASRAIAERFAAGVEHE